MQRCLIERDSALVSPDVLIEYCIRFTDFLVYIFFVRNYSLVSTALNERKWSELNKRNELSNQTKRVCICLEQGQGRLYERKQAAAYIKTRKEPVIRGNGLHETRTACIGSQLSWRSDRSNDDVVFLVPRVIFNNGSSEPGFGQENRHILQCLFRFKLLFR